MRPVEWITEPAPVAYAHALAVMEERARAIREEGAPDRVWLLEHPALYTAGTSAKAEDLLDARFPVHATGRGGQYTYHGPGQRVVYAMMDLKPRGSDVRAYVCDLEEWVIRALKDFGVQAERRAGRVGIWVEKGGADFKIAAIGVRVRKWVAYHGVAVNVNPDLSHFDGIVPCGISGHGVTSLHELGAHAAVAELDAALKRSFNGVFTSPSPSPS
jgi:lipoyl(octanoyl) transferase